MGRSQDRLWIVLISVKPDFIGIHTGQQHRTVQERDAVRTVRQRPCCEFTGKQNFNNGVCPHSLDYALAISYLIVRVHSVNRKHRLFPEPPRQEESQFKFGLVGGDMKALFPVFRALVKRSGDLHNS